MKSVLVVDDEQNMCSILKLVLQRDGYLVATAHDGEEAIGCLETQAAFDLIICDLKMPKVDGMGLLRYLSKSGLAIPLIMITAYGTVENAVDAMKAGAVDFIMKPFNRDVVRSTVNRVIRIEALKDENRYLREASQAGQLVYRSSVMEDVLDTTRKVSEVPTPVLLTGESGTGKGLIARLIHDLASDQSRPGPVGDERPFIRINCPSIPESLFESELFGFRKGAFTGATQDFKGKFRLADGGTLFLDEIAELPVGIQSKLLRVLEEKAFEPLGGEKTVSVDTKIVCATNRDLGRLVELGQFRSDLFYRINAITIQIPPLRERSEDIAPLAQSIAENLARELGRRKPSIRQEALHALEGYRWPGNVRELKNVLERAIVLSSDGEISLEDLPAEVHGSGPGAGAEDNRLAANEKELLRTALTRCDGNVSAAAKDLGISRATLRYRMAKYHIV